MSLRDIPDEILISNVFALIGDIRTRNRISLVCRRWRVMERATRTSLTLRGNVRDLFLVPTCFRAVTHLDLSLISPWGLPLLHSSPSSDPSLLALRLSHAFPSVTSLTLYARTPDTLALLAPCFPRLDHVRLVRWHQRPQSPLGSDFVSLFHSCPSLTSLDLSHFYCWTEDLPPALQAYPSAAASITRLNLLSVSSPEGFKSRELLAISSACPNLAELLASCTFDPRYMDFVGDETLLALASDCPALRVLHLADASALSGPRPDPDGDADTADNDDDDDDARITGAALDNVFSGLPLLEELALDVSQNVRDAGRSLGTLHTKCPKLRTLLLGRFRGVCRGVGPQLDGIALCRGLESLSLKNCVDLDDYGLIAIAQGCLKLAKFHIHGCDVVTGVGIRNFAGILSRSLVDVSISACKNLDCTASLLGLEPVRHRIQRLHVDCVWEEQGTSSSMDESFHGFDEPDGNLPPRGKKCRYTVEEDGNHSGHGGRNGTQKPCKTWNRLQFLSLWVPVGGLLTPLPSSGLESCPELGEIQIKVEGDCRRRPKPKVRAFGLAALACYPRLQKLRVDCGDVIGFALTAPSGNLDLSLWERFFLTGIAELKLVELDYWPPHDRDVNQRSLYLPAAALLAQCATLRKLFIHGTSNEHFLNLLLKHPNPNLVLNPILRDVQLRGDYYPAPENDMSTEMRVDSCSRFDDALNRRIIHD